MGLPGWQEQTGTYPGSGLSMIKAASAQKLKSGVSRELNPPYLIFSVRFITTGSVLFSQVCTASGAWQAPDTDISSVFEADSCLFS